MSREFDYIIYGASGFTGQFVVERLATFLQDRPSVRWAVAGRNVAKIERAMRESSEILGTEFSEIPIITADSGDVASLSAMAKRGRVVINCVGPYRLYGEPVVKACVEAATSMVDISGEPNYIEGMEAKYHQLAEKNGCYIVSACGWDSIPCDLGVDYLLRQAKGTVNSIETFCQSKPGDKGYVINSGTYQTILLGIANASKDNLSALRRKIMPDRVPKTLPKLEARLPLSKQRVGTEEKWALPFPGSDRSVVQRSTYYRYHHDKQRPVQVQCYMLSASLVHALATIVWAIFVTIGTKCSPILNFMQRNVSLCTAGAFSEQGPTREQANTTHFTYWVFGKAFAAKVADRDSNPDGPADAPITVRCDGTDPGYNATSSCVVSAAMSIVEDGDRMPSTGGVYTPAVAFGNTNLLKRLAECDITFRVVERN